MSRSPYRYRADAAECWQRLLFGQLIQLVDRPVRVAAEQDFKLPGAGRWETGLARLRPAFDDALGATALAVAWRWACADRGANAWPGLPLLASKATDRAVQSVEGLPTLAEWGGSDSTVIRLSTGPGLALAWSLWLPEGPVRIGLDRAVDINWAPVDRIADIAAAWLDAPWDRSGNDAV